MITQLASASAVIVPPPDHRIDGAQVYVLTPASAITLTVNPDGLDGQLYFIKVTTSGTSSFTLTFSTGFKTTGTLATGTTDAKTFLIGFVSDGQQWNEISRTSAM